MDLVFGDMSTIAFEMLVTQIFSLLIGPFISGLLTRTKHDLDIYLKTLAHAIVKVRNHVIPELSLTCLGETS